MRGNVTGLWKDLGRFKTPTLRALSARAPYFHGGSAATLEDVVRHCERFLGFMFTDEEREDPVALLKRSRSYLIRPELRFVYRFCLEPRAILSRIFGALLKHLASEINKTDNLPSVTDDGLEYWLMETPISVEQAVELVGPGVIALAYRVRAKEMQKVGELLSADPGRQMSE